MRIHVGRRARRALVLLLLLAGISVLALWGSGRIWPRAPEEAPPPEPIAPVAGPAAAPAALRDQTLAQQAVGTWEDDYKGHRTMTLLADGSGTMIVELSGLSATLFAARLEFDMQWSVRDGRLHQRTVGGRPAEKVNMVLKMMGDRADYQILELTETRLHLLDRDGKTQYDWRRSVPRLDSTAPGAK
jgi:hypothetical protein